MEILAGRGYDLKSASSTIDNITAQSLIEEFSSNDDKATDDPANSADEKIVEKKEEKQTKTVRGPIVKSKEDLAREKHEKEEAAKLVKEKEEVTPDSEVSSTATEISGDSRKDQNSVSNLPAPPVKRASAPPPPPANAGKSAIPSPPSSKEVPSANDEESGVVEGNLIIVKPPIVVRFCRIHWAQTFQLISELMEMGIFASMNQTIDEEVARKVAKTQGL